MSPHASLTVHPRGEPSVQTVPSGVLAEPAIWINAGALITLNQWDGERSRATLSVDLSADAGLCLSPDEARAVRDKLTAALDALAERKAVAA